MAFAARTSLPLHSRFLAGVLFALALVPLLSAGCGERSLEPGPGTGEPAGSAVGQGTYGIHGHLRLAFLEGVGCSVCDLDRPLVPGLSQRLGVVEALDPGMPSRLRLSSSDLSVLSVPDRMMDDAALRDFSISSLAPGQAELRFYTEAGELYDAVTLTVEKPARVAFVRDLSAAPSSIEESNEIQLRMGETLPVQPVALSRSGQVMQSLAFALEVADPGVAGFAAFSLAGSPYTATRQGSGTLVARQTGTTTLSLTTAGAFRDYTIVVAP
jgi:hypothetical protein